MDRKYKIIRALFIVVVIAGAGLAAELTRIYVQVRTSSNFESACSVNEKINCVTVAESAYSAVFSIPVSIWGLGGMLALLSCAFISFTKRESIRDGAVILMLAMTIFSVITSIVLFYIAEFLIHSVCPYCMATYAINLVLFILAIIIFRSEGGMDVIKRTLKLVKSPLELSLFLAVPGQSVMLGTMVISAFLLLFGHIQVEIPKGPGGFPVGVTEDGYPWIGSRNPLVTITEFSDYQCPHCRNAHAKIRNMLTKYSDQVRIIHRNLPLDDQCHPMIKQEFHPCACDLASYAVCAKEQGKFWETNDYLFALLKEDKCQDKETVAKATGLDPDKFFQCLESDIPQTCIQEDIKCCIDMGIFGTPTYVCEEDKFTGGIPEEKIVELIKKAEVKKPSG